MQQRDVRGGGGMVFWTSASWSDQTKLKASLDAIGLGDYAPKPMALGVALKESLEEVMRNGTKNILIRPLAGDNGFCVMQEQKGATANQYQQKLTARFDAPNNRILFNPYDQDLAAKIVQQFNEHRGYVSGSEVGSALVALVKKLSGTPIRRTGGLYWLPSRHADTWKQIAEAVESASVYGASEVYLATMEVNAESIRVVRDAIRREIVAESSKIEEEITSSALGKRALESRMQHLEALKIKVAEYEEIVGEALVDLRDTLDRCASSLGVAAFQQTLPEEAVAP